MKELFCDHLHAYRKSIIWLKRSYERCQGLESDALSEEDIEKLETFAARFSRSVDILINKLLRSLDMAELEDTTRKLDTVIRAEKRGFVESYEELIELKNLRNELAHEYIEELFLEKVLLVKEASKKLFAITDAIEAYLKRYDLCGES